MHVFRLECAHLSDSVSEYLDQRLPAIVFHEHSCRFRVKDNDCELIIGLFGKLLACCLWD